MADATWKERMLSASHLPIGPVDVETLYRAHAQFIAGFLRRLGVPAADLEDATQEVFMVAHRRGGYLPGPAQPRTWLAAIAVHIAQAGRRVRARREPAAGAAVELLPAVEADPAQQLATQRALDRVQRALERLPLEQRAAFVLFEIEGESCESIAAAWKVPVGTVYSRLHHARQRFLQAHQSLLERAHVQSERTLRGER